jgi:hypothetical protein
MSDPLWVSKDANGNINGVYANPQSFPVEQAAPDDPAIVAYLAPPLVAAVNPVQGRIALLNAGLLDKAKASVDAAGGATAIWWEYATTWERANPLLNALGFGLGLSSDQIDALFVAASQIK